MPDDCLDIKVDWSQGEKVDGGATDIQYCGIYGFSPISALDVVRVVGGYNIGNNLGKLEDWYDLQKACLFYDGEAVGAVKVLPKDRGRNRLRRDTVDLVTEAVNAVKKELNDLMVGSLNLKMLADAGKVGENMYFGDGVVRPVPLRDVVSRSNAKAVAPAGINTLLNGGQCWSSFSAMAQGEGGKSSNNKGDFGR